MPSRSCFTYSVQILELFSVVRLVWCHLLYHGWNLPFLDSRGGEGNDVCIVKNTNLFKLIYVPAWSLSVSLGYKMNLFSVITVEATALIEYLKWTKVYSEGLYTSNWCHLPAHSETYALPSFPFCSCRNRVMLRLSYLPEVCWLYYFPLMTSPPLQSSATTSVQATLIFHPSSPLSSWWAFLLLGFSEKQGQSRKVGS